MTRLFGLLVLMICLPSTATSQTRAASATQPDAAALVKELREKYAKTKYYNIEATKERIARGDFSSQWERSVLSAAMIPGNRYRFEGHNSAGWITKISDGRREWVLDHVYNAYTDETAPPIGPSKFDGPIFVNNMVLLDAQALFARLSSILGDLLAPVLLKDETLTLSGKKVRCYVVRSRGRARGGFPDATRQLTIWIDKETHAVRKLHSYMDGMLVLNNPEERLVEDETTVYAVADLDVVSLPDAVFKFQPPAEARLVDKFSDPLKMPNPLLVGKMAADMSFQAADGKRATIKEFRGKAVLLDFWATWCGPCVASLPQLEKVFREVSPKGLVLISIDEDQDAKTATDFWTKHAEPWSNYHDDTGEIQLHFPPGAIPEVVLIDASGKITYTSNGFDESALRAAIAQLGPEFAATDAKPAPQENAR